ncbi:hypothetical protein B9479_006423 [Cryptococcus floricola]|uniref:Protein FAM50A n=1 Tax=Cryptococcus floricola TaxID=2591691 RepID=A0A5D3AQ47_9TREE|nr:hypothetical protein B9479_006423 [Cryptococcus floricola]
MSGPPEESLRTLVLTKQREKEAAEIQRQKEAITKDSQRDHTVDRFVGVTENLDERLIKTTVGLVSLSEFQKTKSDLEEAQRKLAAQVKTDKPNSNQKVKKAKKKNRSKLSFDDEEGEDDSGLAESSVDKRGRDEEGEPDQNPKKKSFKNPGVDTSFLPDRNRELEEAQERERLRKEWLAQQEKTKNETIEITYSFWDGSGHRNYTTV